MRIDWCYVCKKPHALFDEEEFERLWRMFRRGFEAQEDFRREFHLPLTGTLGWGERFAPLWLLYEKVTGHPFNGPRDHQVSSWLWHSRLASFGPPCPYCGKLLRNKMAKQCFECGMDWHDPQNVTGRKAWPPCDGT